MLIGSEKSMPNLKILFGFPHSFPISSEIRRLEQRKIFALDIIAVKQKNVFIRDIVPVAAAPSRLVMNTLRISDNPYRARSIAVRKTVSFTILFLFMPVPPVKTIL